MYSVIDVIYCLYRLIVSRRTLFMHKLNPFTVNCFPQETMLFGTLWTLFPWALVWEAEVDLWETFKDGLLQSGKSFYLLLLQLKHGLSSSSINEAHLSDPVRAGAGGKRHVSDPSLLFHSRKWLRIKLLWRNSSECWESRNDFITRLYLML